MFAQRALKIIFLLLALPGYIQAAIIHVPGGYPKIQDGINAAVNGDTVLVADGVYIGIGNTNLDFKGKAITLRSKNGNENCIIDCESITNTRGFYFHSGETSGSVLDGFTIRNGKASDGAGIHCYSSSPTIINNNIRGNSSRFSRGGGIFCLNSSPIITRNIIAENSAYYGSVYCDSSSPTITDNIIIDNSATYGGGICLMFNPSSTIMNNVIADNSAYLGGGLYLYSSTLTMTNNTITGNTANRGGGVYCNNNTIVTVVNTILWNASPQEIYFHPDKDAGTVSISYSDIQGGQAGIITNGNGTVNWLNGNINVYPVFVDMDDSNYHLSNYSPCIGAGTNIGAPPVDLEGHIRGIPPDIGAYENSLNAPLLTVFLTSPNGGEALYGGAVHDIRWGASGPGIDHIRLLYSTDGGNTYPNTIISSTQNDGIYKWTLPAINSNTLRVKVRAEDNNNNLLMEDASNANFSITTTDNIPPSTIILLTGTRGENSWWLSEVLVAMKASDNLSGVKETRYRINNGAWRVYYDPFVVTGSTIYYKSEDNFGNLENEKWREIRIDKTKPSLPVVTDDGSYVNTATKLHASWTATDNESGIFEYYYAIGTRSGGVDVVDWTSAGMRTEVTVTNLNLVNRQTYYFGVKAKNAAGLLSDAGWSNGISINSAPVVIQVPMYYGTIQAGINAAVNGDTVLVADGIYTGIGNAGIDFKGKIITVRSENGAANCIIDCGNMVGASGFFFHTGEDTNSILDGFTIRNCKIAAEGGGIYMVFASPTITNCIITGNSSYRGGGIYCESSSPVITNSIIVGNSADYSCGGGIYMSGNSSPIVVNSVISGNSAYVGGGICCDSSVLSITNSTIAGNTASRGGGIYCSNKAYLTILNTILWNQSSKEIYFHPVEVPNSVTISYSDIRGGQEGIFANNNGIVNWLEENFNADPKFVNLAGGNYHLLDFSPCIGAGINIGIPSTDIEGNPRPNPSGSNTDLGAYENSLSSPSGSVELNIEAFCPVNLSVTDPEGRTISKDASTIPSAIYSEVDLNGDGDPDDKVTIPCALVGIYLIEVISEPDAEPDDTYTLDVTYGDEETRLAANRHDIPDEPFKFSTSPYILVLNLSKGWNMASCPGDPVNNNVASLLENTSVLPEVYTWDAVNLEYKLVSTLEFGTGYWFAASSDAQVVIEYQPRKTLIRPIKMGWNMIGSVSGNVPVERLTSEPPGAALPFVYTFNPATWDYDLVTEIKPRSGYWLVTTADATLTIDSSTPGAPGLPNPAKQIKPSWESVIKAQIPKTSSDETISQELVFGMHPSASEGFDRLLDRPLPPLPITVQTEKSHKLEMFWATRDPCFTRLDKSFKGESPQTSWELSVELAEPGELQWEHLPTAYGCMLNYNGNVIQMERDGNISLPAGRHTLTLVLGSLNTLPSQTRLLTNYPNPSNPETWIPYELSEDADVEINIYTLAGQQVRRLVLGHKPAGFYVEKAKAAYWDGKNESGEYVASGVYFYNIKAGDFIKTRKMVISK